MIVADLHCITCQLRLYSEVSYCPFCGSSQSKELLDPPAVNNAVQKAIPPPLPVAPLPGKAAAKSVEDLKDKKLSKDASSADVKHVVDSLPDPKSANGLVKTQANDVSNAQRPSIPPAPVPSRSNNSWVVVTALVILVGGGAYYSTRPSKQEMACNVMLTDATGQFTAGNIQGARSSTLQVLTTCPGEIKERANALLAQIDKASVAKTGCDKLIRTAESQFGNRQLTSARSSLDQLDGSCMESPTVKTLKQRIAESQTISLAIEADLRNQITQGNFKSAKAVFDQLVAQNRENTELSKFRDEIQAMARSTEAVLPSQPSPALPQELPTANRQSVAQADLTQAFLKDAEQALATLKFDAARTYAESARRMDPNNAQTANLLRRIKEKELQYLRDETTIK